LRVGRAVRILSKPACNRRLFLYPKQKGIGDITISEYNPFENPASIKDQILDAERAIRAGFIASLVTFGITFIVTYISVIDSTDIGYGTDWVLFFDVGIVAILAIGIWFKSRTAATLMFIYFVFSKILTLIEGRFDGIVFGLIFLFFYGRAMIGTFRYHSLVKKGALQTDVF